MIEVVSRWSDRRERCILREGGVDDIPAESLGWDGSIMTMLKRALRETARMAPGEWLFHESAPHRWTGR